MLTKLNPKQIVVEHWKSFRNDSTDTLSLPEVVFQIIAPAIFSFGYKQWGEGITENAAGIVVSAASIAAGLLLNLMVLIYTLVYNAKSAPDPIKNLDALRQVCNEALATIAYCILLSLGLVLAAFFSTVAKPSAAATIGEFFTVYLGTSTVLCILIILKRVFALVHFEIRR